MTRHAALHGIFVPLTTPLTNADAVADEELAGLAHRALDDGAAGLVALGTTAETATLDDAEKRRVLDVCAQVCRERNAPLIVGAGSNDTRASVAALAELASRPEVAAALVTVPYFTRPTEAGVRAHFARLAANSPVPLIIYHVPDRTGQAVSSATLRELGRLPAIIGVKYATTAITAQTVDLLGELPADFAVLGGDDAVISPLLALGATGGILASAHLAATQFVALAAAWQAGDAASARDLGARLARVSAAVFSEPNPTVLKGVLHAQGRISTPNVRLPLLPAARASVEQTLTLLEYC